MKLFKSTAIFFILILCTFKLQAQETITDKEEEIKSQKIAFFTNKIGLTPEEAQVFWPIYNSYWERKIK